MIARSAGSSICSSIPHDTAISHRFIETSGEINEFMKAHVVNLVTGGEGIVYLGIGKGLV